MVDPDIKRWLLKDEEEKIKNENRTALSILTALQYLPIFGLIWQLVELAKSMITSLLQPDFASFIIWTCIFLLIMTAANIAKHFFMQRKCSHVYAERSKTDEDAYIDGTELVLTGKIKGKDVTVRIPIRTIGMLESDRGRTSFTYRDQEGKIVIFSCLDYYNPQIATLLTRQGIR